MEAKEIQIIIQIQEQIDENTWKKYYLWTGKNIKWLVVQWDTKQEVCDIAVDLIPKLIEEKVSYQLSKMSNEKLCHLEKEIDVSSDNSYTYNLVI